MDALEQARHKSYKRLIHRGLSHEEAMIKAGLAQPTVVQTVEPVVDYEVKPVVVPRAEVRSEKKETGKVRIEVTINLDPPIVLRYSTNLRGALLKTQQNRKFLADKFRQFLSSFLGRVDDVH